MVHRLDHFLILHVNHLVLRPQVGHFPKLVLELMAVQALGGILSNNEFVLQGCDLTLQIRYDFTHLFVLLSECLALILAHSNLFFESLDEIL